MEQALGPRGLSTPDVIKSALDKNEVTTVVGQKISTNTIDNLFGVPDKITIPERYIPDAVSVLNVIQFEKYFELFNFRNMKTKSLRKSAKSA